MLPTLKKRFVLRMEMLNSDDCRFYYCCKCCFQPSSPKQNLFVFLFPSFFFSPFFLDPLFPLAGVLFFSRVFKNKASFLFFILSLLFLCCFQPGSPKQCLSFMFSLPFSSNRRAVQRKIPKTISGFPGGDNKLGRHGGSALFLFIYVEGR